MKNIKWFTFDTLQPYYGGIIYTNISKKWAVRLFQKLEIRFWSESPSYFNIQQLNRARLK